MDVLSTRCLRKRFWIARRQNFLVHLENDMTKPPSYDAVCQGLVVISAILCVYVLFYLSMSSRAVFTDEDEHDFRRFHVVTYRYCPAVCQPVFWPLKVLEVAIDDSLVSYGFTGPGNDRSSWL